MSGVKVKICGLSEPAHIMTVNRCRPDYIGFVFAPQSRRRVAPGQAGALRAALAPGIQAVGVFVNAPVDDIRALVDAGTIDMVQLHGDEDAAYIEALRRAVDVPVIRAVRVGAALPEGLDIIPADYLLFDTASGAGYGGTGKCFDWGLLSGMRRPYFLAGGLAPHNIDQALALRPYAVDCSSGVETGGLKDAAKIAAFVEKVHAYNERMDGHE